MISQNIPHEASETVCDLLDPKTRLTGRKRQAVAGQGRGYDRKRVSWVAAETARVGEPWDQLKKFKNRARPTVRQQSRAIGAQITADDPPLRVFLKRFYEAALAIYLESGDEARGCYSISTAPAQAVTDAGVRDFLAASINGTDAFVAKQIVKARERGEVPSDADPQALAQLATAALHTLAVRARVGVPRKQLTAVAAAAIDVICGPQKS